MQKSIACMDNTTRQGAPPPDAEQNRHGLHIYGKKYALTFEADTNRRNCPTVAIDAAPATGVRVYDWTQKIRIQPTLKELPVVAAVMLGFLERCEFKARGEEGKGFSVEHQRTNVLVRIWNAEAGSLKIVPIDGPDTFRVNALLLKQLRAAYQVTDVALVTMLKNLAVMHSNAPQQNRPINQGR